MGEMKAAVKERDEEMKERKDRANGNLKVVSAVVIMKGRVRKNIEEVSDASIQNINYSQIQVKPLWLLQYVLAEVCEQAVGLGFSGIGKILKNIFCFYD